MAGSGHAFSSPSFFLRAALLAVLGFGLAGCTVTGTVIGAGAAAGIGASQERGLEAAADDLSIQVEINRRLLAEDDKLFSRVSTQVSEGRVLLTGVVDKPEERVEAVRIAWSVKAVREVISEIRIEEGAGLVQAAKDTLISSKLRSQIMRDTDIVAINYSIETVRGWVYLMGIAQNQRELTRVINHARDISGVRNIISHLQLKDDPDRRAALEE